MKRTELGMAKAGASNITPGAYAVGDARVASAPDRNGGVDRASCAARPARGLAAPAFRPVRLLLDTGAAEFLANGEQGKLYSRRVSAKDAQGILFDATGGGPLWDMV